MNAQHHGQPPLYGQPPPYGQPPYGQPTAAPAIDLYAVAKKHAWSKLWGSILAFVGGIVLSAIGLAVGFLIIFGFALVVGGIIMFFVALAAITDPTRSLKNLGHNEVMRRQVLRMADAELSTPTTSVVQTTKGRALLGPSWLAYHDDSALLVSRREDVLWFYLQAKKSSQVLKVHLRSGNVVEFDFHAGDHHLLNGLVYALPAAITGFDPRWAALPIPMLAQEVDRRRYALG